MTRALVVSALLALTGVPSITRAPQIPLFAFESPDPAADWQAVTDGVMGGASDGGRRVPCGPLVHAGVGSVTGA
jgi:hypothetical protein